MLQPLPGIMESHVTLVHLHFQICAERQMRKKQNTCTERGHTTGMLHLSDRRAMCVRHCWYMTQLTLHAVLAEAITAGMQ